MNKTHLIMIPFTGVGKVQYKSDEWFRDRIEIFKNYTLKSLLNQTNQNFHLWFSFREEERFNPLTIKLFEYLIELELEFAATFNGLMYYDDRNQELSDSLKTRLEKSLSELKLEIQVKDFDYIYLTRLDSDDMLHKDAVQLIQDNEPNWMVDDMNWNNGQIEYKALTFQLGIVYNKDTNEVAEWNPLTNPPFHTIIFPRDVFFDAQRHIDWYEGFKSHEDIARLPHKVLWREDKRLDRLYCVFTHNPAMHISTGWNHPFRGNPVDNEVLKEFGI